MVLLERQVRARKAHVARMASFIGDPILRLRFLRTVAPQPWYRAKLSRRLRYWILSTVLVLAVLIPFCARRATGRAEAPETRLVSPQPSRTHIAVKAVIVTPVWQVEKTQDSEVYSNGLRIETRSTVSNHPRLYLAFPRDSADPKGWIPRSQPVGIIYHATESSQAPFEARDNRVLKRLGESLLEYVRRKCAYHYLIDRFGRVYRVVAESDTANHAGYSVWADDNWLYLNLNDSFFGVSLEAQTHPGQAEGLVSPAQVRSAAMLTEMLRSRYQIPAENCVTHAQVSVNPLNMRVGYHTDWAAGFPFAALGLPDNYARALPSLWAFGFECEPVFLRSIGERIAPAVKLAEQDLLRNAARSGMQPEAYRNRLRKQYREWLAEVRRTNSGQGEEDEQ